MPELPEVESVCRQLHVQLVGRWIEGLEIRYSGILKNPEGEFRKLLLGKSVTAVNRRGKMLQIHLNDDQHILLAHLKMTGQFLFRDKGEVKAGVYPLLYASQKTVGTFRVGQEKKFDDHLHVIFEFRDGSKLAFRDQRKFAYLHVVTKTEAELIEMRFGIEPLREGFTIESFQECFRRRKKSLKAVLMDQQLIAGIGNIYADEICFRSGIRPQRIAAKLSSKELSSLHESCEAVLQAAVDKGGTTLKDYIQPDGSIGRFAHHLQVYGRGGEACLSCSGIIKKVVHQGRGTHFCENCQK
ncbi:MAG: bifunctional DNA-formamidopyrimidine glycosylase/DNA-(apurinic or apyrimidinic site) lyase [bacterium]|nr:bifunctional DNA-formamidopyrimidine glycosylase/DNA-(apurinic or apyrimidinic site) lyase [bacterium]